MNLKEQKKRNKEAKKKASADSMDTDEPGAAKRKADPSGDAVPTKRCLEDIESESDSDSDVDEQVAASSRHRVVLSPDGILDEKDWDSIAGTLLDVQDDPGNNFDLEGKLSKYRDTADKF